MAKRCTGQEGINGSGSRLKADSKVDAKPTVTVFLEQIRIRHYDPKSSH